MLVLFDNDGTLVDSERLSSLTLVDMARDLGLELTADVAIERYSGRKMDDVIAALLAEAGLTAQPAGWLETHEKNFLRLLQRELKPAPGIELALAGMTFDTCVVSNARPDHIDRCLSLCHLDPYFPPHRRFSAHHYQCWKPDPRLFAAVADDLNVPVEHCVVVEDSAVGQRAALDAGMIVLGYRPVGVKTTESLAQVLYYQHHSELNSLLEATAEEIN